MPTPGNTLYDETIKNGFGKILVVQNMVGASFVDFVAPFADAVVGDYGSYVFLLDSVRPAAAAVLAMNLSTDGTTWDASLRWGWALTSSNNVAGYYGANYLGGGAYFNYIQLDTGVDPAAFSGSIAFNPGLTTGAKSATFALSRSAGGSTLSSYNIGCGSNVNYATIRAVRFGFTNSSAMYGFIRLCGLRRGA